MSGKRARSRNPAASQASLSTPVYNDRAAQSSSAASSAKSGKGIAGTRAVDAIRQGLASAVRSAAAGAGGPIWHRTFASAPFQRNNTLSAPPAATREPSFETATP